MTPPCGIAAPNRPGKGTVFTLHPQRTSEKALCRRFRTRDTNYTPSDTKLLSVTPSGAIGKNC